MAFGFLTILPNGSSGAAPTGSNRAWFPLVGLALGGALAGLDIALQQALPGMVVAALLVAALLVLTRALHTEGFLDMCDGLLGGYSRSERLRILSDSHVGACAVVGGTVLILVKWSLLAGIPDPGRIGLLVLFPCMSRLAIVCAMAAFPYARQQGAGSSLQTECRRWQVALALGTALVAGVLLAGIAGLILAGGAVLLALGLGRWFSSLLGG